MSRVQITLEKLEELKFEIIKEIEEVTEGIVSEFHIDVYKRQPLYGARYHSSLLLLLTGSCPSRARKSVSGILLTASISVLYEIPHNVPTKLPILSV